MSLIFNLTLCLIGLISLVSCATGPRSIAQEKVIERAPDYFQKNKEVNRQYVRNQF